MNNQSVNIINDAFWLKYFLGETLLLFQQQKIDTVWYKYGEIVNSSKI